MAIIKQAKNIRIITTNKDVIVCGDLKMNTQKKMTIDATEENLEFNSRNKIKANGRS